MDFNTNFWAGVGLAAALATAIATVLTVLVSIWWRRVDQARPTWLLADGESAWSTRDGHGNNVDPSAEGHLANVGTGSGHHVQAVGLGCLVRLSEKTGPMNSWGGHPRRWPSFEPVAPSGWQIDLTVYCEPSDWGKAQIAVLWSAPSLWATGLKRRVQIFPLSQFAPRPALEENIEDLISGVIQGVPRPEPAGPVLPDSLRPRLPLPTGGWLQRRSQRRALLRSR